MGEAANDHDTCVVTIEEAPDAEDVRAIEAGLEAYNSLYAPPLNYRPLTITLRTADGTLVGGLLGETYWSWLYVRILWLAEHVRGRGYGSSLLAKAEQEAVRRGCHRAHLDTMSFQALSFYERHGYTVFGVLHDVPPGHSRYSLQKELQIQ
jgi:GNAT superfamily N-acetyltransferase